MLTDGRFWIGIVVGLSIPIVYHWFTGNLPCKTS